jgi:hypothetical protein
MTPQTMKISPTKPLPLDGGVGVNFLVLSPLTSILSHGGERRTLGFIF